MMKTIITILFLLTTASFLSQTTDSLLTDKSKFKEKIVFGGNVGANFGANTFIEVSPTIGYRVSEKTILGLNLNFNYFSNNFQEGFLYGPGIFARYNVTEGFFLHSEFQQSFTDFRSKSTDATFQSDFPMFLVGGGYFTQLGGSRIGVSVLFDLLQDRNNYYDNPIIRGGVLFGF
ncbi:MAG: hypothetical protein ACI8XB_000001 [Patiriisocius sp.]|jgi:hypothetical protein